MRTLVRAYRRKLPHSNQSTTVGEHSRNSDYKIKIRRQLPKPIKVNPFWDSTIRAKKPGKRKSNTGNVYYERRFNRSDEKEFL